MSAKVKCPHCDRYMLVESEEIGTQVKCVLCAKSFTARPDWMVSDSAPEKKADRKESKPLAPPKAKKKEKRREREKQKEKEKKKEEELQPDERWKPPPDKFITCPECGKKLPETAYICNQCGWNLKLGRALGAGGSSLAGRLIKFALVALILVLLGAGIGIAVRYLIPTWRAEVDRAAQPPKTELAPKDDETAAVPDKPATASPKRQPEAPTSSPRRPAAGAAKRPDKPAAPTPQPNKPTEQPKGVDDLASAVSDAVVIVRTRGRAGLGFVVDAQNGIVATNRHLLEGGQGIGVIVFKQGSKEPREFPRATIAAIHKKADVALVQFNPRGYELTAVALGEASSAGKGGKVFSIVRPSQSEEKTVEGTIREGRKEIGGMACLLTTVPVDAAGSGGALFDKDGRAVGVNTYSEQWAEKSFAIDAATVRELLDDPAKTSLAAKDMDELLKKGIDPLRSVKSQVLVGRTVLEKPVTKLIPDEAGVALYALQPEANAVLVLSQNKVAGTLFVGANPVDFDITPDGKQLYVAVNRPTGISIMNTQKRARDGLVRVEAETIFAVRALERDLALVICGVIYKPGMKLAIDAGEPLAGVKVMVVNVKNDRVEQELTNGVQLPVLTTIASQMPKKWTSKNMEEKREWHEREVFAERLFIFPAIGRTHDGKSFFVASYDEKNATLTAKDEFRLFRYSSRKPSKADVAGADRVTLYVSPEIKEKTVNRKKTTKRTTPGAPDFAHFPQTMVVSRDGKTILVGTSIVDGESLLLTGSVRRDEEAQAEDPLFCNIYAAPSDFKVAFTGTTLFAVRTFTEVARLPFMSTVLTCSPDGKRLHVFNPADNNVYTFDVNALSE